MWPSRAACGTRRPEGIAATMVSIRRDLDRRIVLSAINPILAAVVAATVWHLNDIVP